jgi:VanZ family protein
VRELHYRKLWLGIGAGLVVLVIYLSLTPDPVDVGKIEEVKTGHFLAYAVLMLWFAQIYRSGRSRIAVGLLLVLMGVVLEYAQAMTGYRSFGYVDMRDNAIGVTAGLLLGATPLGRALSGVEAWLAR